MQCSGPILSSLEGAGAGAGAGSGGRQLDLGWISVWGRLPCFWAIAIGAAVGRVGSIGGREGGRESGRESEAGGGHCSGTNKRYSSRGHFKIGSGIRFEVREGGRERERKDATGPATVARRNE